MKHFYQDILGWASEDEQGKLLETILPLLPKDNLRIVEIGVFRGRGTALWNIELLKRKINYEYYAVDNFLGFGESETAGDKFYDMVLDNLKPIQGKVNLIKNNSVDESEKYPNNYFDIVYLDADHDEKSVDADIKAWLPKLKKGGIMCGDDYIETWIGVVRAVIGRFEKVNTVGKQQWWIQI